MDDERPGSASAPSSRPPSASSQQPPTVLAARGRRLAPMSLITDRPAAPAPPSSAARTPTQPPAASDPAWARAGLIAVLLVAAVLVGWGLTRSGMSNTYYAAAVKSATV